MRSHGRGHWFGPSSAHSSARQEAPTERALRPSSRAVVRLRRAKQSLFGTLVLPFGVIVYREAVLAGVGGSWPRSRTALLGVHEHLLVLVTPACIIRGCERWTAS